MASGSICNIANGSSISSSACTASKSIPGPESGWLWCAKPCTAWMGGPGRRAPLATGRRFSWKSLRKRDRRPRWDSNSQPTDSKGWYVRLSRKCGGVSVYSVYILGRIVSRFLIISTDSMKTAPAEYRPINQGKAARPPKLLSKTIHLPIERLINRWFRMNESGETN